MEGIIKSYLELFLFRNINSGIITAIVTFRGGTRQDGASGGDYFIGFIVLLIALGFSAAALADFFMLTKV